MSSRRTVSSTWRRTAPVGPAVTADVTALPFRSGVFDVVVAAFVVNHLPDPVAGLTELRRVTRPGGAVLASTFSADRAAAKAAVDGVAAAYGFVAPDWYARPPGVAHGRRRRRLVRAGAGGGGLRRWTRHRGDGRRGADRRRPTWCATGWGCRTCTRSLRTLSADAREALVAEAVEAVRRTGERFAHPWWSRRVGARPDRSAQSRRRHASGTPRRAPPPRGPRARPAARRWPARAPIRSRRPTSAASHQPSSAATSARRVEVRGQSRLVDRLARAAPARSRGPAGRARRSARPRAPRRPRPRRLGRVERGRGVLLGQRQPGQEQQPALVEAPLVVEPPGARTRPPRPPAGRRPRPGHRRGAGSRPRRGGTGRGSPATRPCASPVSASSSAARVAEVAQHPAAGRCACTPAYRTPVPRRSISRSSRSSTRSASALRPSSP